MRLSLIKLTFILTFGSVLLCGHGLVDQAQADSRPVFSGRAAQAAEQAPPQISEDAAASDVFLLSDENMAPAAGDAPRSGDLSDPYYDQWEDDEFDAGVSGAIADPLEPWNRFWFHFNDILWRQYGQAVWQTYELITPAAFRQGVSNFFNNLAFPVRFVNCLLQGKPLEAGVEFQRFIMNSTLGFGGLMNPAANSKPLWSDEPDVTGFGQTLGRWGVGDGFYIVWPVFGPSTARESVGMLGDFAAQPLTWTNLYWDNRITNSITALRANHTIGENIEAYNSLMRISVEPYSALRNAYVQGSRNRVLGTGGADMLLTPTIHTDSAEADE